MSSEDITGSAEPIFRYEYGRLVAILTRKVGVVYLELIEDSVQHAMMAAVEHWPRQGKPDKPSAWLYRVAYRQLIGELRQRQRREQLLVQHHSVDGDIADNDSSNPPVVWPFNQLSSSLLSNPSEYYLSGEVKDALLRMLFIACHPDIPVESRLVFTLKSLCGFSIREIALRLFTSEANVYKRLSRARQLLKQHPVEMESLSPDDFEQRLPAVHKVLYLLFTEGHLSSHTELAIRQDLCEEAIRLATFLLDSRVGAVPETSALLALMYLHMARMHARQDDCGSLLLLEQQDRSLWDQKAIGVGLGFLEQSAQGEKLSRYHVEAGIAAEHCLAPSFEQTRWQQVATSYALLEQITQSPLHRLNRAVAVAEWQGLEAALAILQGITIPGWLEASYLWLAVKADLYRRCANQQQAEYFARQALELAPTKPIRQLLQQRLGYS